MLRKVIAGILLGVAVPAAATQTVCTITVNSPDEARSFRRHLPTSDYKFVELVERGRPDWLATACERQVSCDVLVVSGHFAGIDFYSDKVDVNEYLPVEEMERAACSGSCPALFSKLREVYLFGCNTLNPEDAPIAAPTHGESNRDRMRRIFAGVPVIYGFAGPAPVGPTAGSILDRAFRDGLGVDIARGRPSGKLLGYFARNHMVSTRGVAPGEPLAQRGREVCRFLDERLTAAQRIGFAHELLAGEPAQARAFLGRLESSFALSAEEREDPTTAAALRAVREDREARGRYLAWMRRTQDPATRSRFIDLAHAAGWLDDADQGVERVKLASDLLARDAVGPAEVDLVCALNSDGRLDAERHRLGDVAVARHPVARAAIEACLGDEQAESRMLAALSSADDREVRLAQAYLRQRPVTDSKALRAMADGIARMPAGDAQVRAIDALARLRIADLEVLALLARAYERTPLVGVQRAIAEVFLRADKLPAEREALADAFRRHRLPAARGEALIDAALKKLDG